MECKHENVEYLHSDRMEGETYGDVYGKCRDCGFFVKAFGHMEDDPYHLEPSEPWEIDTEAMMELVTA